jgi:hypothetical protein
VIHYVIDASAAAEYLLRTPLGLKLADLSSRLEIEYPNRLFGVMIFLWHNTTL